MEQYVTEKDWQSIPAPDWASRPWGRPTIHATRSDLNENLVGTAEFRYHGIRLRGVRIMRNVDTGAMSVNMPTKRFGESIEPVFYFVDPLERDQFISDVIWLWCAIFGPRLPFTPKPKAWFDESEKYQKGEG